MTTAQLDGRTVVISGSGDYTVKVWDAATGETLRTLTGHTGYVGGVTTTELGGHTFVISGSDDKTVRTWDLQARTR